MVVKLKIILEKFEMEIIHIIWFLSISSAPSVLLFVLRLVGSFSQRTVFVFCQ